MPRSIYAESQIDCRVVYQMCLYAVTLQQREYLAKLLLHHKREVLCTYYKEHLLTLVNHYRQLHTLRLAIDYRSGLCLVAEWSHVKRDVLVLQRFNCLWVYDLRLCVDASWHIEELQKALEEEDFEVERYDDVALLTIRNYTDELYSKYIKRHNHIVRQVNPESVRVVMYDGELI